jgi:hypothetical protein
MWAPEGTKRLNIPKELFISSTKRRQLEHVISSRKSLIKHYIAKALKQIIEGHQIILRKAMTELQNNGTRDKYSNK